MFYVTKTYDHSLGLSSCFRQHKAKSHCNQLHGYALSFKLTFGCDRLNECNWVVDFGGLKLVKEFLCYSFDHTFCVADDDPLLETFRALDEQGAVNMQVFEHGVGCEAFAEYVWRYVDNWLQRFLLNDVVGRGLHIVSVECREHGANSAIYEA